QITSCGGTFPYQTTPEFFQVLHHIMPMSYSVDSIRHIINSQNYNIIYGDVYRMIIYLALALVSIIGIAAYKRYRLKNKKLPNKI
ncbi:MAG: hypothetical protein LBT85_03875, partial [Bifidobacteriaceae bacterium]|nr:hypothetical protein [Bifidobacteriaceae bacterium]